MVVFPELSSPMMMILSYFLLVSLEKSVEKSEPIWYRKYSIRIARDYNNWYV